MHVPIEDPVGGGEDVEREPQPIVLNGDCIAQGTVAKAHRRIEERVVARAVPRAQASRGGDTFRHRTLPVRAMAHPREQVRERVAIVVRQHDLLRARHRCTDATLRDDALAWLENREIGAEWLNSQALPRVALVDDAVDADAGTRGRQRVARKVGDVALHFEKHDPSELGAERRLITNLRRALDNRLERHCARASQPGGERLRVCKRLEVGGAIGGGDVYARKRLCERFRRGRANAQQKADNRGK